MREDVISSIDNILQRYGMKIKRSMPRKHPTYFFTMLFQNLLEAIPKRAYGAKLGETLSFITQCTSGIPQEETSCLMIEDTRLACCMPRNMCHFYVIVALFFWLFVTSGG